MFGKLKEPQLISSHKELLLGNMGCRRTLGSEDELEVTDDLIDDLKIFNK